MSYKVFLVSGKAVKILRSYTHTYRVRFIKSGKEMEVHKKYVISWTVNKQKPIDRDQLAINF